MQCDPSESSLQASSGWLKGTYTKKANGVFFLNVCSGKELWPLLSIGGMDADIASWK